MSDITGQRPRQRPIHGQAFLDWLKAAEIIPDRTTRVVIEACVSDVVKIYVEQYGTEGMVSVDPVPALGGAQIIMPERRGER